MEIVEYFLKQYDKLKLAVPRNFNKQDWEEALQDTYLSLLNTKESVQFKSTYINRAIRGNVSHIVSKRKTIGSRLEDVKIHIESGEAVKTPEQLMLDVEYDIARASDAHKLTSLIKELPDKQKMIMQDVISGFTVTEAGRKRNLNINTTKHNYLVGLKTLKQKIGVAW